MRWWPWGKSRQAERRSGLVSISDPVLAQMLGYSSVDGVLVSERTAMTLSAVFRAVSLVSGSIASLPLRTLIKSAGGETRPVDSFLDNPGGTRYTPFEWKQLVLLHLLLHGNAYIHKIRNPLGAILEMHPIHPLAVSAVWDFSRPGGKRFDVQLLVAGANGQPVAVTRQMDSRDLIQIMGISFDGLKGVSPISLARTSLSTGIQGDQAASKQFSNGAMISGMVTPDDEDEPDPDETKALKREVNNAITGVENAGGIAVLNRRLKFTPWTLSAVDAQFLESRTFSVDEVGRWFGVPPHLLGLTEKSTSWGQGIAEQNRGLARYTLTSWTSPFQERLSRELVNGQQAEFDYSGFVKPSPEDEIKLVLEQVNGGLITPNEGRKIRNLPPITDGTGDTLRLPPGSNPPSNEDQPEKVAA